jgi:hypothetical protein
MRFVFEIPDQLLPSAAATATSAVSDAISGGAAPASTTPETPALTAVSAGQAESPTGGVVIADSSDAAIDGGAAPD